LSFAYDGGRHTTQHAASSAEKGLGDRARPARGTYRSRSRPNGAELATRPRWRSRAEQTYEVQIIGILRHCDRTLLGPRSSTAWGLCWPVVGCQAEDEGQHRTRCGVATAEAPTWQCQRQKRHSDVAGEARKGRLVGSCGGGLLGHVPRYSVRGATRWPLPRRLTRRLRQKSRNSPC